MMNAGVSGASFPHVIFSPGTAPEYEPYEVVESEIWQKYPQSGTSVRRRSWWSIGTTQIGKSPAIPPPIWKNPTVIAWVLEGLKYLVFAGIAGYLLFGVALPFLRKLMARAMQIPVMPDEAAYAAPGAVGYDQKVEAARNLARQEPKAVATVIKDWVGGGSQPAGKVQ